jgi:hypothetical protein
MWTGPATGVLLVGGMTALLFALLLPETRPSGLVGGMGMVLIAAVIDLYARRGRRRSTPVGLVRFSR